MLSGNAKKEVKILQGLRPRKSQKLRNKSESSSSELPSSSDVGPEDDEEIKLDFTSVETELLQEQSNEWEVGTVNVSQRFKRYQIEIFEKAKTYGLKWSDFHEVLALSSIIVLSLPCPYPAHIFTSQEW
ncbi:hypothetical protein RclHR1_02950016 [Rhizophagus clarus]|uniref:Uncharacterized protein n=1 Tax=Rhizophagus clarus TaxID=94130 RepID=A0A2Z6R4J1_9GLOM|nr:hypothetical protein RclHR1_02950016 [Rhizophagus clarus]